MAMNFWTLALFWGLMKTRLDFSHSGTDRDETQGNWRQPSISISMNLVTTPHPCMPGNAFLVPL